MSIEKTTALVALTEHALEGQGVPPDARILVAVSGGADSVALLLLLHELHRAAGVGHFDHQTRGGASGEDAAYVQHLAARLDLPFFLGTAPVTAEARLAGESFEQAARRLRYAFLLASAREHAYTHLATAHTRNDQVETLMMRVLRGTGVSGLSGIPAMRVQQGITILRPLLEAGSQELRRWLKCKGQDWREDLSNRNKSHLRNRVRHELLPRLRQDFNPELDAALLRLAENARADDALLEALGQEAYAECVRQEALLRVAFARLPLALQRRVLLQFAWNQGVTSSFKDIERARVFVLGAPTGNLLEWGHTLRMYAGREAVQAVRGAVLEQNAVALPVPGEVCFGAFTFRSSLLTESPAQDLRRFCTPQRQIFDARMAGQVLMLRNRRDGDRFQPLGMEGTRKLSDYFTDLGVPAPDRSEVPLLESERGILWVVGHAASAVAAVKETTRLFLLVEVAHDAL